VQGAEKHAGVDDVISSLSLTPPYDHSQAAFLSPKPSSIDSLDYVDSLEDTRNDFFSDTTPSLPWDTSWELNLAFFSAGPKINLSTSAHVSCNTPMATPSATNISESPSELQDTTYSDSLAKLHRISLDLHTRAEAVELHKEIMNLDMMIYRQGPLFMDNLTLLGSMLKASQDFVRVLAQLCTGRLEPSSAVSPQAITHATSDLSNLLPQPCIKSQPSKSPIALAITDVFTQLVDLYELNAEQLSARIERIHFEPVAPIPELTFGGVMMVDPCIQGMMFSDMVIHLIEKMERLLGISGGREGGEGLLSLRQKMVLWIELGGENEGGSDYGMMRPRILKKAFQNTRMALKRISLNSI
jgi:hypothetical protein